jgi:hypothetical protein
MMLARMRRGAYAGNSVVTVDSAQWRRQVRVEA